MARIVVIGAGIAGLATAVTLQRCGHDVSVVERLGVRVTGRPAGPAPVTGHHQPANKNAGRIAPGIPV